MNWAERRNIYEGKSGQKAGSGTALSSGDRWAERRKKYNSGDIITPEQRQAQAQSLRQVQAQRRGQAQQYRAQETEHDKQQAEYNRLMGLDLEEAGRLRTSAKANLDMLKNAKTKIGEELNTQTKGVKYSGRDNKKITELQNKIKSLDEQIAAAQKNYDDRTYDYQYGNLYQKQAKQDSQIKEHGNYKADIDESENDAYYRAINGLVRAGSKAELASNRATGNVVSANSGSIIPQMTEEERNTYNYIFDTEGSEAAKDYLNVLEYNLASRYKEQRTKDAQDMANSGFGGAAAGTAMSIAEGAVSDTGGALSFYGEKFLRDIGVIDNNLPINYQKTFASSTWSNALQEQVTQNIDSPVGRFLYGTGVSIADNVVRNIILAPLGSGAILGTMAVRVAGEEANNALSMGATENEAALYGVLSGIGEVIGEKVPLEKLLKIKSPKTVKEFVKTLLGQAFTEGMGEAVTTVWNDLVSANAIGELSDYNMAKAEYVQQGMSEEEAEKQATKDAWNQILLDALGGAISGVVMGGGAMGLSALFGRANGKKAESNVISSVVSDIDESEVQKRAAKYEKKGMSTEEAAQKAREDIQNERAKKYTAQGMSAEEAASAVETDDIAVKSDNERLRGEILARGLKAEEGSEANIAARAIQEKLKSGESVSAEEWKGFIKSTREQVSLSETKNAIKEAARKSGESVADTDIDVMAAAMEKNFMGRNMTEAENKLIKGSEAAKKAYGELTGLDYKTGEVIPEIVRKKEQANKQSVEAKIKNGLGKEITNYAGEDSSQGYKNTLSKTYKAYLSIIEHANAEDITQVRAKIGAKDYAEYFEAFYEGGRSGEYTLETLKGLVKNDSAAAEALSVAYELGRSEGKSQGKKNARARQAKLDEKIRAGKEKKAAAPRGVARSITKEELETGAAKNAGAKSIDMKRHFSQKQRYAIAVMREFAKMTDINIVFYQTEDGKGANGWYDRETDTIYIDLFSGFNNEQAMLRTLSHELTHFMEKYSPEHYEEYKQFLLDYYYGKDNGETLSRLIEQEKRLAPNRSAEYWQNEVVANASEMFINDENAMRALIGEHAGATQTIDEWFKKMNYALRRAFKGVVTSGTAEADAAKELKANVETFSEAQRRWSALLKESVEAKKAVGTAEESGEAKFSMRVDSEGRELSEAQQEYFEYSEVRNKEGLLIPVYHATDNSFTIFDRKKLGAETDKNADDVAFAATAHIGFWFNSNDIKGKTAQNKSLAGYLNIEEPYYVDSIGALAAQIMDNYGEEYGELQERFDGRDYKAAEELGDSFAEWLERKGDDGIIVEDEEFGGTSYVALKSNQFKNADNQNPTENPDIRFSMRHDADYMKAVESGDTETAQRLVDEAAKAAGYDTEPLYHGTQNFGFTKLDVSKSDDKISFFATSNPDIAQTYSGKRGTKKISSARGGINGLTEEEVVDRLNKEAVTDGFGMESKYRIMRPADIKAFFADVDKRIEKLDDVVERKTTEYADRLATDFNDANLRAHSKLVALSEALQFYNYDKMSTPLWVLLNNTDVFNSIEKKRYGNLEADIRLRNGLAAKKGIDEGAVIKESLDRYEIRVKTFEDARNELAANAASGNYVLRGKTKGLLEIDGNGHNWNDIFATLEPKGGNTLRAEYDFSTSSIKLSDKNGEFANIPAKTLSEAEPAMARAITKQYGSYFAATVFAQAKDQLRNSATAEVAIKTTGRTDTRTIAEFAKEQGYRGVKIINIFDNGGRGANADTGNVYIYFYPQEDVKSADAVTYDEKGKVIPLSERFNAKNDDIRFSMRRKLDSFDSKEYNEVKLGKQEYARLSAAIGTEQPNAKGIVTQILDNENGDPALVYTAFIDDSGKLKIINKENAKYLREGRRRYNANEKSKSFDRYAGEFENQRNDSDSSDFSIRRKANGRNDGVFGGIARGRDGRNGRGSNQDVSDSSEGSRKSLTVSDLGKIQYQLRIEDKKRLDILDRQETRLTADLKTLEKAYAETIRAEYERSIKPSEETSKRAAEINRKAAKRYMNEVGATFHVPKDERSLYLLPIINEIIDKGPAISESEGLIERLYRTAYKHSAEYAVEGSENEKNLREYIRKTAIYVDPGTKGDVGDYEQFRKNNTGSLKLTGDTNALSIDEFYAEVKNAAPDIFSDTTDGAEQLYELSAFMKDRGRVESIGDYMNEDESVKWAMDGDSSLDTELENLFDKTVGSFLYEASRKERERTNAARINRAMDNVRSAVSNYGRAQEYARAEGVLAGQMHQGAKDAAKLRTVTENYENRIKAYRNKLHEVREKRDAVLEARKEAFKNYRAERADSLNRSVLRKRIIKDVRALNTMLLNPTDNKHIPQELRGAVAGLLGNFTDNTSVFSRDKLERLKGAYSEIAKEDNDLNDLYDPDIAEYISKLEKRAEMENVVDGRRLSELSADELFYVQAVTEYFTHVVRDGNALFIDGRRQNISEIAAETISAAKKHGLKTYRGGALGEAANWADKYLNYDNITPVYFFNRMGGGMKRLFNDMLYNSQLKYAQDINEDQKFMAAIYEKYHVWGWTSANPKNKNDRLKFVTERREVLDMTRNEVLTAYVTYKRGKANGDGAIHMMEGGIVVKSKTSDNFFKKFRKSSKGIQLTYRDLRTMFGFLTAEQKACADAIVNYLTAVEGARRNETSMALYGYKKFNETYYFPYRVASDYVKSYAGQEVSPDGTKQVGASRMLKNMGSSKALNPNANAAIVIDDFFKVVAESMNDTARYHAFAVQQDNFMRVLNYKGTVDAEHGSTSVKQAIRDSFGAESINYITGLMGDSFGGAVQLNNDNVFGKLFGKFKKTAVAANLSVAIQQPSAIVRATALIDGKYLLKTVKQKNVLDEMYDYSSTAFLKNMGRFDIGTGRSAEQYILKPELKGKEYLKQLFATGEYDTGELDDLTGFLSEKADWVTWGHIMNAVMAEIEDTTDLERGTEEFKRAAGRRFDEIVNATQVYDSILTKSPMMRSQNSLTQIVAAFKMEPTLSYNVFMDSIGERKTIPSASRGLISLAMTTFANALLKSLIGAMRDRDKDKTYLEKYAEKLVSNIWSDLIPILNLPGVSAISEAVQGFTTELPEMGMISDTVSAVNKAIKKIDNGDWGGALGDLTVALNLFGLPVRNIYRDISAIFNTAFDTKPLGDTSLKGVLDAALEGLEGESFVYGAGKALGLIDTSKTAGIKRAMKKGSYTEIRKATNKLIEEYVAEGKSKSDAKGYIKTALTNYWKPKYRNANEKERAKIRRALFDTGIYENTDAVVKMCNNWLKDD